MALPENIIKDFEEITNFDLTDYLGTFVDFIANGRLSVIDYYAGESEPNTQAFDTLNALTEEKSVLSGVIDNTKNLFKSGRYWELIETLSEVDTAIDTINNSSKWLRSAISKGNFNPAIEIQTTLRQFQTLENLSVQNGAENGDVAWIDIAMGNDLAEEGYTTNGGNVLNVQGRNRKFIQLNSVVDNISGKKVYGLDLNRKITFESDDLNILGYDDTIKQSVGILTSLRKGDNPEFPEDGIQSSLVNGANRRTVAYPILMRQFFNTFSKDDTLKSLKVTSIENVQDALKITFEIETRLAEVISEISTI